MKSIKRHFLIPHIIQITSVLIILAIFIGEVFKNYYVASFNELFQKEGMLLLNEIERMAETNTYDKHKIHALEQEINADIYIADESGNPIYNLTDLTDLEKKELQSIYELAQKESSGIKHSKKLNISYFWSQIDAHGERRGTLIVSSKKIELDSAFKNIWMITISSVGAAFIIILMISIKLLTQFTKPIESATDTAIELAKGNYHARTYEDEYSEFGKLSSSINILARNLQQITKEHEVQKDRLMTLIENMGSGLILIDDKGYITLTNRTFKEVFRVQENEIIGFTYADFFEDHSIREIIDYVFMTEQRIRKEIIVPIGIQRKTIQIYGAPILSFHNEWKGIVIVFHDITELKKLEQIRKDFVANVSHELKTPITSIRGFAETLLDGALKDEKALEHFLTIILKESERLQSIINDLLELSKIEQQGFKLKYEHILLKDVFDSILPILKKQAAEKEIVLDVTHFNGNVKITTDPLRLKQIFVNLISNAIAYTPKKGRVELITETSDRHINISVKDNGIGMTKEEIPRIFERFYRIDKDRSRNSGGTGLGLAIVKHLVEAMDGEISVESTPGSGSVFTVKLNR